MDSISDLRDNAFLVRRTQTAVLTVCFEERDPAAASKRCLRVYTIQTMSRTPCFASMQKPLSSPIEENNSFAVDIRDTICIKQIHVLVHEYSALRAARFGTFMKYSKQTKRVAIVTMTIEQVKA